MAMTTSYTTDVVASTTINPLADKTLEIAPGPGTYDFYATQETGQGTLQFSAQVNGLTVIEDVEPVKVATFPTKDNNIGSFVVVGGEKILAKIAEIAGTATVPQLMVRWTPAGEARLI